jgi:serine/threonine protein kinase
MGKEFGKWVIQRQLGEGGQGHTYLVREKDSKEGPDFVLKRLKNKKRIERFRSEIEAGLRLSHPNLIRVVDSDIEHDPPYFVAEYCSGGSLEDQAGPPRSILNSLRLMLTICEGVAHAHKNGIIHRDLKPGNIFLKEDGTPVVGDFGLCHLEDGQRFTATEEAVGPRHYMAPELEDGRADKVGPPSDVYSLGKVLYWLLTGKSFAREKHRDPSFDLTRTLRSADIFITYELLDKTIVGDPEKRFPDANAFAEGIKQAIRRIEMHAHAINRDAPQLCSYCGIGIYRTMVEYSQASEQIPGQIGMPTIKTTGAAQLTGGFGFEPRGSYWLIFVCDYCGHVQMFRPDLGGKPDIWKAKKKEAT